MRDIVDASMALVIQSWSKSSWCPLADCREPAAVVLVVAHLDRATRQTRCGDPNTCDPFVRALRWHAAVGRTPSALLVGYPSADDVDDAGDTGGADPLAVVFDVGPTGSSWPALRGSASSSTTVRDWSRQLERLGLAHRDATLARALGWAPPLPPPLLPQGPQGQGIEAGSQGSMRESTSAVSAASFVVLVVVGEDDTTTAGCFADMAAIVAFGLRKLGHSAVVTFCAPLSTSSCGLSGHQVRQLAAFSYRNITMRFTRSLYWPPTTWRRLWMRRGTPRFSGALSCLRSRPYSTTLSTYRTTPR